MCSECEALKEQVATLTQERDKAHEVITDILASYDHDKAACDECGQCGPNVMCSLHSVLSMLATQAWTPSQIERDTLRRRLAEAQRQLRIDRETRGPADAYAKALGIIHQQREQLAEAQRQIEQKRKDWIEMVGIAYTYERQITAARAWAEATRTSASPYGIAEGKAVLALLDPPLPSSAEPVTTDASPPILTIPAGALKAGQPYRVTATPGVEGDGLRTQLADLVCVATVLLRAWDESSGVNQVLIGLDEEFRALRICLASPQPGAELVRLATALVDNGCVTIETPEYLALCAHLDALKAATTTASETGGPL